MGVIISPYYPRVACEGIFFSRLDNVCLFFLFTSIVFVTCVKNCQLLSSLACCLPSPFFSLKKKENKQSTGGGKSRKQKVCGQAAAAKSCLFLFPFYFKCLCDLDSQTAFFEKFVTDQSHFRRGQRPRPTSNPSTAFLTVLHSTLAR